MVGRYVGGSLGFSGFSGLSGLEGLGKEGITNSVGTKMAGMRKQTMIEPANGKFWTKTTTPTPTTDLDLCYIFKFFFKKKELKIFVELTLFMSKIFNLMRFAKFKELLFYVR